MDKWPLLQDDWGGGRMVFSAILHKNQKTSSFLKKFSCTFKISLLVCYNVCRENQEGGLSAF